MGQFRDLVVRGALALSLFIPFYFAFAALGSKFGIIGWRFGLGAMMIAWGPLLLLGAAGFAAIALLLALLIAPRRGRRMALAALAIPVLGLGYAGCIRAQTQKLPPIHDISTDLADPPAFSAAVEAARAATPGGNGLDRAGVAPSDRAGAWSGMSLEEAQRAGYPDIASLDVAATPEAAFDAALAAAQARNWTIGETNRDLGRIEATATSFWFGFVDDIAIRVRGQNDGARIDVRSVSRVGVSDLGANAARVRAFQSDLRGRLSGAAPRAAPSVPSGQSRSTIEKQTRSRPKTA